MPWTSPSLPSRLALGAGPTFVGRRHELAVLDEVWAAVLHGSRQVVFVGGEPGAGKSRLMAEVCSIVHRNGATVLLGACAQELGPVYQPFGAIASALLPSISDEAVGPSHGDAAWPLEVRRRLQVLAGVDRSEAVPEMEERREVFDALVGAVVAASEERPTVLVLEDLHWAGTASLQLLGYLVENCGDARILVLAAHRTTAPDGSEALLQEIAHLYRLEGVRRLDLPPLDTEEVAEFLRREGGVAAHRAGAAAVILRDRTGGNPFFLREVWRDLAGRGGASAIGADTTPAPDMVRDTINRRLAGLTDGQRDAVSLAAVSGEVVDVGLVQEAAGGTDVHEVVDRLVDMGLLEELPHGSGGVRFVHALARQSVLDLLGPSVRAQHHERLALTLRARDGDDPNQVERLAHHFAEAAVLGRHAETAVDYLVAAGELADRRLAHQEAAQRFEWAARLGDDVGTSERLLLRAARSRMLACDFDRAMDLGAEVSQSTDPALRLAAATAFEDAGWYTATAGPESLELLLDALADVPPDPLDPGYVRGLGSVARALAYVGGSTEGEEVAQRALALARRGSDDELMADVVSRAVQVGYGPASSEVRLRRAEELTDLAVRTRQWRHLGPAAFHRSVIAYQTGDLPALALARRDLHRTARASGQRYWRWLAGCADYAELLAAGDLAGADRTVQGLLELGSTFGGDAVDGAHGVQTFMVRREAGRLGPARAVIDGHEPLDEHWAPALMVLYVELGMAGPARRMIEHVLGGVSERHRASARWPGTLAFLGEAAAAHGDRQARERARDLLSEHAGRNLVMGPFIGVFGAADRYLGVLDSLLGQGDPDTTFAAALELDHRMGARLHEALTLTEWSRHVRRTRPRDPRAGDLAARARGIAEPAGLVRVLARLDVGSAQSVPAGLTPRELQVVRLLAEGCSNRAVAGRLAISENTAANHVRSILAKTGSENRTQAVRYATDHGLVG